MKSRSSVIQKRVTTLRSSAAPRHSARKVSRPLVGGCWYVALYVRWRCREGAAYRHQSYSQSSQQMPAVETGHAFLPRGTMLGVADEALTHCGVQFGSQAAGVVDMVDDGRPLHPSRPGTGLRDGTAEGPLSTLLGHSAFAPGVALPAPHLPFAISSGSAQLGGERKFGPLWLYGLA